MRTAVRDADAPATAVRAALNHLALADSWGVLDADGLAPADLASTSATVVDLSGLDRAPASAVVRAVAEGLYHARVEGAVDRLPWLLLDEAHAFTDGVAAGALRRILTCGRAPGVSLALATQRPSALPAVAVSQSDLLVAHRLTSERDLDALARARPTYLDTALAEQLPTGAGDVVVVDDATETVHAARVRRRHTPHGGDSPSVSEIRGDDSPADHSDL
jgi:DNA helicase HerA-like ATPase